MLVRERMSRNPVTITPDVTLSEALRIMRESKIRRLPVLDKKGKLVGIVLEKDLLYASPSPATSLSVYELSYLVSKIKVGDLMAKDVITIEEDCPLEEAARIMADNEIGGLPVMRGDALVGMITESDLFKVFLELLGARDRGTRVTVGVRDEPGVLAELAQAVASRGGDFVALGTFTPDPPASCGRITFKVQGIEREVLEAALREVKADILDIRET